MYGDADTRILDENAVRQIELPAVPRSGHDVAGNHSFRQRTAAVQTQVVERVEPALDVEDANPAFLDRYLTAAARGDVAKAVQTAWQKLDVVQCGYCQSGQIMSAIGLLSGNKKPSDSDIDAAMDGNVCRCATYQRIRAAIHEASTMLG